MSNSIAYFFLQLVEAKRNKDYRKCTTPSMKAGTQWSIFNSNRRGRRVFHVTSSVLVPSVESTAKLSFPCHIGRHCSGNTSFCIRRSTSQFPVCVTWRFPCAVPLVVAWTKGWHDAGSVRTLFWPVVCVHVRHSASIMKLIDFTVSTFVFPTDVTVLLSLTFFLNMVAETMPPTSERPLIGNENCPSLIS